MEEKLVDNLTKRVETIMEEEEKLKNDMEKREREISTYSTGENQMLEGEILESESLEEANEALVKATDENEKVGAKLVEIEKDVEIVQKLVKEKNEIKKRLEKEATLKNNEKELKDALDEMKKPERYINENGKLVSVTETAEYKKYDAWLEKIEEERAKINEDKKRLNVIDSELKEFAEKYETIIDSKEENALENTEKEENENPISSEEKTSEQTDIPSVLVEEPEEEQIAYTATEPEVSEEINIEPEESEQMDEEPEAVEPLVPDFDEVDERDDEQEELEPVNEEEEEREQVDEEPDDTEEIDIEDEETEPENVVQPEAEQENKSQPEAEPVKNNQQNRIGLRSFWEIYHYTNCVHITPAEQYFHNIANMRVAPSLKTDTLQTALDTVNSLWKGPLKLFGVIANKVNNIFRGTNEKYKIIEQRVNSLSPEEFAVLTKSSEEANAACGKVVKHVFDSDFLSREFMSTALPNQAYLSIVGKRLERESLPKREAYANAIKDIDKQLERTDISAEEKANLEYYRIQLKEVDRKLDDELALYGLGQEQKSKSHTNVPGFVLAKNNPDNIKDNARIAQMSAIRREAIENNDVESVSELTKAMREALKGGTRIITVVKEENAISRGSYNYTDVTFRDKGKQTKTRDILAASAVLTAGVTYFSKLTNDARIEAANVANGEKIVKVETPIRSMEGAKEAEEAWINTAVGTTADKGEVVAMRAAGGSVTGSKYREFDSAFHESTDNLVKQVEALKAAGKIDEANMLATSELQGMIIRATETLKNYAKGSHFNLTATNMGNSAGVFNIPNFFNSKFAVEIPLSGVQISKMSNIPYDISLLSAAGVALNSLSNKEKREFQKNLRVEQSAHAQEQVNEHQEEIMENNQPVEENEEMTL